MQAITLSSTIPQPKLDTEAAQVLASSLPGERRADADPPIAIADTAPATLGLSKAFNSLEATVKLAAKTGMAEAIEVLPDNADGSATEARALVGEMRKGPGWSKKDKTLFAASVAGATVVGAIIVLA